MNDETFNPFQQRLIDMVSNQRKDIKPSGGYDRITFKQLRRIDLNLRGNIFGTDCVLWANEADKHKKYIGITFNGKKVSLLRLLYLNYIDDIDQKDFIYYLCENRGKCCCLNHFGMNKN